MKIGVWIVIVFSFSASMAAAAVLCPNGSYVSVGPCTLCPDGSYVGGGAGCELTPNGGYVAQEEQNNGNVPQYRANVGQAAALGAYRGSLPYQGTVNGFNNSANMFQAAMQARAQQQVYEEQQLSSENAQVLEESKRIVLNKYPELNDDTSERAKVYLQVLKDHPEFLNMPRGPEIAMREMEARLERGR